MWTKEQLEIQNKLSTKEGRIELEKQGFKIVTEENIPQFKGIKIHKCNMYVWYIET